MSNWKLTGEIERLLKRVVEGNLEFDNTWDKVHNASTQNLKDKYEAELKKEIKKLQRYRDQIKTWISSSDVKNKSQLINSRKSIERQMERFKILEKESKTKAYSKEGLAKLKKKEKADPRDESYRWIRSMQDKLNDQIAELEEQMESVNLKGKRGKSKKAVAQFDQITEQIHRHNWHIDQLKTVKTRLENKEISINQGKRIREDVEWYIDSNQEPEFVFDEYLYDAIDDEETDKDEDEIAEDSEEDRAGAEMKKNSANTGISNPLPSSKKTSVKKDTLKVVKTISTKKIPMKPKEIPKPVKIVKREKAISMEPKQMGQPVASAWAGKVTSTKKASKILVPDLKADMPGSVTSHPSDPKSIVPIARSASMPSAGNWRRDKEAKSQPISGGMGNNGGEIERRKLFEQSLPLRKIEDKKVTLPPKYREDLSFLQQSMKNAPMVKDTDRPKQYIPRNPYRTPASFPKDPEPALFDNPEIFRRFSTDTLFFIFYFQQGTRHQYLAARELKRLSWRYHKKFLTWFQRHDAPTFTNDACERGTYVYFDYESSWNKRLKSDFTFEYSNLEDELRV